VLGTKRREEEDGQKLEVSTRADGIRARKEGVTRTRVDDDVAGFGSEEADLLGGAPRTFLNIGWFRGYSLTPHIV